MLKTVEYLLSLVERLPARILLLVVLAIMGMIAIHRVSYDAEVARYLSRSPATYQRDPGGMKPTVDQPPPNKTTFN